MSIYQEQILQHYHNPLNNGILENATHSSSRNNPTCGDKMKIDMIIKNDKISEISFSGEGCAISQATASMLTEQLKGETTEKLKNMTKEDILSLLGIELSHARLKCALLSLETAQKALDNK